MFSILRQGEQLVWKKEFSKGFWHRTVVKTWAITNQRILIWNNAVGYIAEELPLEFLSDVQVINQSHVSNSSFNMMSTGGGTKYSPSRYSYGQSHSIGQAVGDVIFMRDNGLPFCVFHGVSDPNDFKTCKEYTEATPKFVR